VDSTGRPVVFADKGFRLQVPVALAAGRYEQLTDEELEEHYFDIRAEVRRRNAKYLADSC
jgi:hypothetical protein